MVEQTPELHAMSQDLDWVLSRLASRGPPGIQYDASTSGEPRAPELALLRPLGSQTAHVGGLNPVAIVVCIAATCAGIVVVRRTRVPRAM
jgi:hypothetical protein